MNIPSNISKFVSFIMRNSSSSNSNTILFFIFASVIFVIFFTASSTDYIHEIFAKKGDSKKNNPTVNDDKLQVQLITEGLNFPTGMSFVNKDSILVIEKNTGKVNLIKNGEIYSTVLDLDVANQSERGLLGIAIFNADNMNDDAKSGPQYVFLFVTETEDKDGGDILGNRLYRYEFVDDQLVNPKLLLDLPFTPGPSHNGGVIQIGKDNNVYLVAGDLNQKNFPEGNTLAENMKETKLPDGRGGILRITQDGDFVKPSIFGDGPMLGYYFGYGIRNSFGIAFDPVTGHLWETENGSNYGDEINMILPGFNGGWRKVLGLSDSYSLFKNKFFDPNSLVNLNGRGVYTEPQFVWNDTIAPTSLSFLDSTELGSEYEHDLFVGSVKQGRIFHFDLNSTRTGLVFPSEVLADKIAHNDT